MKSASAKHAITNLFTPEFCHQASQKTREEFENRLYTAHAGGMSDQAIRQLALLMEAAYLFGRSDQLKDLRSQPDLEFPNEQISCGRTDGRESESVRERLAAQNGGTHDSEYQASPAGKIQI